MSWGSWPLLLSVGGPSTLQAYPLHQTGRQAGKGEGLWTWVPSLCFSILGAELLTSRPSFCYFCKG